MVTTTSYTAIILERRPPFYDWLQEANRHTDESDDNFYRGDYGTYLVKDLVIKQEIDQYLKDHYLEIFENELCQWHDRELWPHNLSYELFEQWYRVHVHREVFLI
jgi:hypothetical protein